MVMYTPALFERFIGELFNLKMLTENIMHDCLFKLLRAKDEESLECLCRLLSTIGKELDSDKAKVNTRFSNLEKESEDMVILPVTVSVILELFYV